MKTDKQVYSIFSLNPRWLFELTGLTWPGPCKWKSVAFKAIEQTADGVLYPEASDSPLTVTEIQAQFDPFIYARVVIEMAMLQREEGNVLQSDQVEQFAGSDDRVAVGSFRELA